jgi:hypothetical protein
VRRVRRGRRRLPADLVDRGFGSERVLVASVAVGALIVVRLVVALVQLVGNTVDYNPAVYAGGFLSSPIGLFLRGVVLDPLPFYVGAFVAATILFPLAHVSALRLVLLRAVAAGAAGTALLIVVGLVTSVPTGDVAGIVIGTLFAPVALGVSLTAMLVGASSAAWLWSVRIDATAAAAGRSDEVVADDEGTDEEPTAEPTPANPLPERPVPEKPVPEEPVTVSRATEPTAAMDLRRFQPPGAS